MQTALTSASILGAIESLQREMHPEGVSSTAIQACVGGSAATLGRYLAALVKEGLLVRSGKARATRYALAVQPGLGATRYSPAAWRATREPLRARDPGKPRASVPWTGPARALLDRLDRPLGTREPVTYQRRLVDAYVPNQSWLLPAHLAEDLARAGTLQERLPAGTYVRRVLEQLLIDLSWSSSRLEGNTYSLLDTEALFASNSAPTDRDGVMLLNHKRAIEFLADAAPVHGLTDGVIRNLHALLMENLLPESVALGAIRNKVVNITGTTYLPTQVPQLLEEMLAAVLDKAQYIKNPVEAAFFLWLHIAYLQPFEDGNKRTSRLAANIPLMLYNCAPLAFLDVEPRDYAHAMLAFYEFQDTSIATELFEWTYRRSIRKYQVIVEAMGAPDAFRIRQRDNLSTAMQAIVREGASLERALGTIGAPVVDTQRFRNMLVDELDGLSPYNCARYRLTLNETRAWIERGRPR